MFTTQISSDTEFVYDPAIGDFVSNSNSGTSFDIRTASFADQEYAYNQPAPTYHQVSLG